MKWFYLLLFSLTAVSPFVEMNWIENLSLAKEGQEAPLDASVYIELECFIKVMKDFLTCSKRINADGITEYSISSNTTTLLIEKPIVLYSEVPAIVILNYQTKTGQKPLFLIKETSLTVDNISFKLKNMSHFFITDEKGSLRLKNNSSLVLNP